MSPKSLFRQLKSWSETSCGRLIKQAVLIPLIVVSMASAGYKLWSSSTMQVEVFVWPLAIAIGIATAHRLVNAYGWALVLRAMRLKINGGEATKLWLVAESRRWLPGGVWGYASRATLASKIGVNYVTAAASMFIELVMVCGAAAMVVVPGVIVYHAELFSTIQGWISLQAIALTIGGSVLFAAIGWKLRPKLMGKVASLRERYQSLQSVQISGHRIAYAALFFVAMNVLNGLVTAVLIALVPSLAHVPLLAVLAASSAAWCVGFFAFFSPGGLFVREAALAAMLMPWIPYSDAFTLAILARIAQLAAEAIAMLVLVDLSVLRRATPLQRIWQSTEKLLPA